MNSWNKLFWNNTTFDLVIEFITEQIPFQFSLHVLDEDGALSHHEYIAENVEMPSAMLEALSQALGPSGSVISWHKSYENTRNREMAAQFPEYARFLEDLTERTVDLEDIFKTGYVDIAFRGSTSIKSSVGVCFRSKPRELGRSGWNKSGPVDNGRSGS